MLLLEVLLCSVPAADAQLEEQQDAGSVRGSCIASPRGCPETRAELCGSGVVWEREEVPGRGRGFAKRWSICGVQDVAVGACAAVGGGRPWGEARPARAACPLSQQQECKKTPVFKGAERALKSRGERCQPAQSRARVRRWYLCPPGACGRLRSGCGGGLGLISERDGNFSLSEAFHYGFIL